MAYNTITLVKTGATGNNTHTGVDVNVGDPVTIEFVVEAVGATPTVTWKAQGSFDNSTYYDLLYITDATDTASAATRVVTATGRYIAFPSNVNRRYRYYRIVTSANTNVTYRAEAFVSD